MAARFWVGGTGTWDSSTTTNWSTTTGGAGGASVPGTSDDVTFDGSSGGGTVTVNFGGLITILSITITNFTGTLDFTSQTSGVTLTGTTGFGGGGAATKTLNLGSGTFTISNAGANWDSSGAGLTLNAGTSTITFTASTGTSFQRFFGGNKTYNNVTIGANAEQALFLSGGGCTIAALTVNAPRVVSFTGGGTYTVTNLTVSGSSSSALVALMGEGNQASKGIISLANSASVSWCAFNQLQVSGAGTITATNSFDLANNTGNLSITPPSVGGGGVIGVIGG
jgi:hypothetical protein